MWLGINATIDDRLGGDMTSIESGDNGQHQYTEDNLSKRVSTQFVFSKQLDSLKTFNAKNSISFFNREFVIPDSKFAGKQWSSFSEINYTTEKEQSDWIFGANLYTSDFDESDNDALNRDQSDITIGGFAKNIYDLSENWILESGFRMDYAKDWGVFPLPKVSLLYKNGSFSSRIGGGLGYKIPDIFIEEAEFVNFENVQGINKDLLDAERSFGFNVDFNYQTRIFESVGISVNKLFYITSIKNCLLLDEGDNGFYEFTSASGPILSNGAETNVKFTYGDFRWFLNYAYIDAKLKYLEGNPQKPLTPKHNAGSVIMYENERWRIGFETYYKGTQLLPDGEKTQDFVTMGLLVMRNFGKINAYMNFENFTDKRQSRFSPLVLPPHDNPSFPAIYAPTDGFIFSAGIILKVLGKDEHELKV